MKLGRYEVVRELGKGAMGIVYLAKDPLIGRLVALKTIRLGAHADDDETREFQQRFIREAQAAGILNHPAIVTVHDIGRDEETDTSFIAMEFVEGHNLKEALSQGRALSFEQIADIIAQVAEALDFAHAKGIVHRDVKPANIILIEGNRAKITDFGIAKIAAAGAANLTSTGQFLGTPNYMAPEQIKGAPVDGRTDIFALGICLYECLTRRKPFGGDSLTSISYKIVHEPFPPLHEINPQIPEGYEELVANCLAKDPTKRYQRARDLAVALRAVLRGEKPTRPADPMLAEETVVTRAAADRAASTTGPLPTMEVPFPEAYDPPADVGGRTNPVTASGPSQTHAPRAHPSQTHAQAAKPTVVKVPRPPVSLQLKQTLTNVRTSPVWRRRIAPPLFIGIVVLLVIGVFGIVAAERTIKAKAPRTELAMDARLMHLKQLRKDGEALLNANRVPQAYAKFEELQRLAPKSPYAQKQMTRLNAMLQQEELSKQQLTQAQQKFTEGVALYESKKYADALASFQQVLAINPNDTSAAEYAKLAQQQEEQRLAAKQQRRTTQQQQTAAATTATAHETGGPATATTQTVATQSSTTQLTTVFSHPFVDGSIQVKAGGDLVANERLYDEKPARFLRRASKTPRPINVTNQFPAKNADVQIWVNVPALNIHEHHVMTGVRFEAGGQHRLTVRYDPAAKKFSYEIN